MTTANDRAELLLGGLDGANPLAFLAALGTFRTLTHAWPERDVRMSWRIEAGAWRPVLGLIGPSPTFDQVVQALDDQLGTLKGHPALALGDNISVAPEVFRIYAERSVEQAHAGDRHWADFASAFACDALIESNSKEPIVQDTALRTMRGAGHQHFLKFMRNIVAATTAAHVRAALFEPWGYTDAVENLTLRWDPADDQRYALRWRNPSGDPTRKSRGSVLGANRLAIEALPLVPTAPVGRHLATTGFTGRGARDTTWSWPIWNVPLDLLMARSVVAQRELVRVAPNREQLAERGIVEVYRSRRITVEKVRNFTPARPA